MAFVAPCLSLPPPWISSQAVTVLPWPLASLLFLRHTNPAPTSGPGMLFPAAPCGSLILTIYVSSPEASPPRSAPSHST